MATVQEKGHAREVKVDLPPEEHYPDQDVSDADVRAEARANRLRLLESGELLTSAELQRALLMSDHEVCIATQERRFFTVEVDGREYYPAFFARPGFDRRALEAVSKELGSLPGWVKWSFFTAQRETLSDMSALDMLARGEVGLVRKVAASFVAEVDT